MFRKSLLVAAALVVCVSAAAAGQKTDRPSDRIMPRWINSGVPGHIVNGFPVMVMTGRPAAVPDHGNRPPKYGNAIFDNIDWKSKNQKWLNYYGFAALDEQSCYYQSAHYHYCISETGNNALPFHGTGKKATKIGVPLYSVTGSTTEYNIGIYSATASGLPGQELAGASATANTTGKWPLTWVNVDVKLKARQEYFLEISCGAGQTDCDGGWEISPYEGTDYYHSTEHETFNFGSGTHTYTSSSPWHETTAYYQEGAAVIL
jgi:hypothetical protein